MGRRMLSGRDGAAGYLQFQSWEAVIFLAELGFSGVT